MSVAGPRAADQGTETGTFVSGRTVAPSASPRPVATTPASVEAVRWSLEGRLVVAALFRALGDPGRLSLVGFIAEAERYGTECAGHLRLAQGRISAHLARLVSCGLITQRRAGRRVFYRIADGRTLEILSLGQAITQDARRADPGHAGTS